MGSASTATRLSVVFVTVGLLVGCASSPSTR